MIRFAADENFNNNIVRGLRRRRPDLDVARVQDAGFRTASDPDVLEWAAGEGRILLTHDTRTIPRFAYERVVVGLPMPGVFAVTRDVPVRQVIEDLILVADCSDEDEWDGQIRYLPLK